MRKFRAFWQEESGLSAIEYIVAGTLIIVVLVAGFVSLGTTVDNRLLILRNALSME